MAVAIEGILLQLRLARLVDPIPIIQRSSSSSSSSSMALRRKRRRRTSYCY